MKVSCLVPYGLECCVCLELHDDSRDVSSIEMPSGPS